MNKIITYFSKSHGKRRYFVSDPAGNPVKDGKPQWSYDRKDALHMEEGQAMAVWLYCGIYGYKVDKPQEVAA